MYKVFVLLFWLGCGLGAPPNASFKETVPFSKGSESYIINGEEAPDGAYPYMISLNFKKQDFHACGASIVTKSWALTAGHCCTTNYEMYLYAGSNSLSKGGTKHEIESYNPHPNFAPLDVLKNDICLIKVKNPFVFGPTVKQVTLPPQNWALNENDVLLLTGWGYISNDEKKVPDKLRRGNFTYMTPQKCKSMTGRDHQSYLCVKQTIKAQGACNGDSGSPLMKNGVQVGVASFVYQPCGFGLPDFYSRVPIFINWIKQTVGSEASELKFASWGPITPLQLAKNNTDLKGLPYIVLGENAENGKYPYQVSLYVKMGPQKFHFCGASVLTKNWVMTAGHCCAAGSYDILVGTNSLSQGGQTYRSHSFKIHPNYDAKNQWKNDICLIKTALPITFNSNVQPVTLPPQGKELKDGDLLDVTGWGYTSPDNRVTPDKLQVGKNYKFVSQERCETLTKIEKFAGYLCVEGNREGAGICQGDSGGPIAKNGVQYGIASFIFMPCGNVLPDYFARVANYIDWIKQTLGPDASELKFSS